MSKRFQQNWRNNWGNRFFYRGSTEENQKTSLQHEDLHLFGLGAEQGLLGLGTWGAVNMRKWVNDKLLPDVWDQIRKIFKWMLNKAHDLIALEVLCDLDQLYDLAARPDVERSGWDGANVEFDVTIMWEYVIGI